jgi:hypothetical protein
MNTHLISEIQYTGFTMALMAHSFSATKLWHPGHGEYAKNLFCSYVYRGRIVEYATEDKRLVEDYVGEQFINKDITLSFPTEEHYYGDTTWLCFSSLMPYTAEFMRLKGTKIVPAGVGAFCVLGTFGVDKKTAKALNYMKPREHDTFITGDAKIILIKRGNYTNQPVI